MVPNHPNFDADCSDTHLRGSFHPSRLPAVVSLPFCHLQASRDELGDSPFFLILFHRRPCFLDRITIQSTENNVVGSFVFVVIYDVGRTESRRVFVVHKFQGDVDGMRWGI